MISYFLIQDSSDFSIIVLERSQSKNSQHSTKLVIDPNRKLNLYTPTETERLNIVDKFGQSQDSYIAKLLGNKYDGLRIK